MCVSVYNKYIHTSTCMCTHMGMCVYSIYTVQGYRIGLAQGVYTVQEFKTNNRQPTSRTSEGMKYRQAHLSGLAFGGVLTRNKP